METDRRDDLLLQWEELRQAGETPNLEELCNQPNDDPAELQVYISRLEDLDEFFLGDTASSNLLRVELGQRDSFPKNDRYRFESILGYGGYGIVSRAMDLKLKRSVAIKCLRTNLFYARSPAERFREEATALAQLDHENIVRIHDAELEEDKAYLILHLVEGGTLFTRHEEFRGRPEKIAPLMAKVASASDYAHDKGFLHCDLKPSNILLDKEGKPYVADFGLVRLLNPEKPPPEPTFSSKDTMVNIQFTRGEGGTPQYMAPEQYSSSKGKIDRQTDIWAMGVILFELMTGVSPFPGEASSKLRQAILNENPQWEHFPAGQKPMRQIIAKCLQKSPQARYGSAKELADDLHRVVERKRSRPLFRGMILACLLLAVGFGAFASGPWTSSAESTPEAQEANVPREVAGVMVRTLSGEQLARAQSDEGCNLSERGVAVYRFPIPEALCSKIRILRFDLAHLISFGTADTQLVVYCHRHERNELPNRYLHVSGFYWSDFTVATDIPRAVLESFIEPTETHFQRDRQYHAPLPHRLGVDRWTKIPKKFRQAEIEILKGTIQMTLDDARPMTLGSNHIDTFFLAQQNLRKIPIPSFEEKQHREFGLVLNGSEVTIRNLSWSE